ncbi:MAG: methionine--tRNA ligase subunit beta [Candidatus Harrisonbacteria bacterium]|nr:methionine--tRNA ligase subunit beta [Candidatus Harrisonbacteria bacterium]
MKKRVIIAHRWSGSSKSDWYPWLKAGLEKAGFSVLIPEINNADEPTIEEWLEVLEKTVPDLDGHTYFVGHSIGCQAILRFLATRNKQAGGVMLVAPWLNVRGLEGEKEKAIAAPWIETKFDRKKSAQNSGRIFALFSDNDPYVTEDNHKVFETDFRAEVVIQKKAGHFTEDDGFTSLPTVLEKILEWEKGESETISFDDFTKLNIRIAKILKAEKIEGADKLLKLTVYDGERERTICAGIAEHYQPQELEGKLIPVLTNLEARKLKGVLSEGMMLAASSEGGKPILLYPQDGAQPGDKVK